MEAACSHVQKKVCSETCGSRLPGNESQTGWLCSCEKSHPPSPQGAPFSGQAGLCSALVQPANSQLRLSFLPLSHVVLQHFPAENGPFPAEALMATSPLQDSLLSTWQLGPLCVVSGLSVPPSWPCAVSYCYNQSLSPSRLRPGTRRVDSSPSGHSAQDDTRSLRGACAGENRSAASPVGLDSVFHSSN